MVSTIGLRRCNRVAAALLASALLLAGPLGGATTGSSASAGAAFRDAVSVIVSGFTSLGAGNAVEDHGGDVVADLSIVDGVEATVPADRVAELRADGRVRDVTPNTPVHVQGITPPHAASDVFNKVTGADRLWAEGTQGAAATVAVIDSGIQADVPDLKGRVIGGVDVTTEMDPYKDSFGHGTFVAGVIAGNGTASTGKYKGMAPKAKLVSVKIAGRDGASNVSEIIKGLEWVVAKKTTYNIRVANLSVGTDSTQPYALSPLNRAVEQAWEAGIVVVVSASNLGEKGHGTITKPADDPFVITVGAIDDKGSTGRGDDQMAGFSGMGPTAADGIEKPEVVASGRSVVSLRAPGSFIDERYSSARIGSAYFKGSGTSHAAGVVSGAAALLVDREPGLNPDQVKARLMDTAAAVADGGANVSGAGSIDAYAASHSGSLREANQNIPLSTGAGTVSADEGSLSADVDTDLITTLLGLVLYDTDWTADPTGSNWWGSNWWGSNWWGSNWWGSNWWGSNWWGSNWWGGWE